MNTKQLGLHSFFRSLILAAFLWLIQVDLAAQENVIRLGYMKNAFTGADLRDARNAIEELVDKIAGKYFTNIELSCTMDAVIYDDLNSLVGALERHEVEIVHFTSIDYLAIRDRVDLEPLFVTSPEDRPGVKYVFLVPTEDHIQELVQLHEKNLMVSNSVEGMIGLIWCNSLLQRHAQSEAKQFFQSIKTMGKISQVVLPVFFEQSDACIVTRSAYDTMVELNPQIEKSLSILQESNDLIENVACVSPRLDPKVKALFLKTALTLHEDPDGRQLLLLMQQKRNFLFESQLIENTESVYRDFVQLSNSQSINLEDLIGDKNR